MLTIRGLVTGHDELAWVDVLNAAYGKFRDWRTITTEELLQEEQKDSGPAFSERWLAETDGSTIGVFHVFEERAGNERKGVIHDFAIVPKFQGSGVEKELARFAIDQLRRRGARTIVVPRLRWSDPQGKERADFLEELGLDLTRRTSLMEIDLAKIPSGIAMNERVTIKPLREHEEDFEELNRLRNKCSKDRPDFRPSTVEEIRYLLRSNTYSYLRGCFAVLDGKRVGFALFAVDGRYNSEKNVKTGIVLGIGVLKDYRKSGIGTALMLYGLENLRAEQMSKAMLDVDDFNETGALRMYERIGFKVLEKYLTYEKAFH